MNRSHYVAIVLALSLGAAGVTQQKPRPVPPAKQEPMSFTDRLLKFLGISASPSTFRAPGDEVMFGDVWLADVQSGSVRSLSSGGGYRSPVFVAGSTDVLVLHGSDVLKISSEQGSQKLYSVPGITKLVAAGLEDRGQVLILLKGGTDGRPHVGLLTITSGAATVLPYDPESRQDSDMVESLQAWTRVYRDRKVYVQKQSKPAPSGTVQWTDVFLETGDGLAVNISRCDGTNCGQPSLSEDGHLAVYVKSQDE